MLLRYYRDESGNRVYTMKYVDPQGNPTIFAHPAKYTPEDAFSMQRVTLKSRFNLLPNQQPPLKY